MLLFLQSLKARLILLILLSALPGIIGIIYQSVVERENAIDLALQRAINTVEITSANQKKVINETRSFLMALSLFKSVSIPESTECSTALADILKLNDNYVNLGIPDADGDLVCNAKSLNKRINVSDRPYIQESIRTRGFSIGSFQIDRATGITSINFAYPVIHSLSNKIKGIAVAVVSLEWWNHYLAESRLPENTVAYISDHNQKIIAAYPANSELLGTNIKNVHRKLLENNPPLTLITKKVKGADNLQRVFATKQLFDADDSIAVSVGIPFDEELSIINKKWIKKGIFLSIFICIMFVLAIKGIQKSVLIPLENLLQATKDLELGINIGYSDQRGFSELVQLQKRFSSMANTRLKVEFQLKKSQSSLQESEERYAFAMKGTEDGLWDWNVLTGEILYSRQWKSMLGYKEHEIKNDLSNWVKLLHPDDLDTTISSIQAFIKNTDEKLELEFRMKCKDGNYLNIISRAFASRDKLGNKNRLVGTNLDITKHKREQENLKLAASVFTHAREGIIITDASGDIIKVNDRFSEMTGYNCDEVIGKNPRFLQSKKQSPESYASMWHTINTSDYWSGEVWNRRKNGEMYAEMKTISAVRNEYGSITHYVSLGSDITLMKEYQHQLEHIAHFDTLTNLPNRALLADQLSQTMSLCCSQKKVMAVAFLDLDGFKLINDKYGHSVGDELLIALSVRMNAALREGDCLARIGGDEFIAVLTDLTTVEDCQPVLERLLLAVSETVEIDNAILNVSTSIGVTYYPQDNVSADQLMRQADQAMYVAKELGKNCYYHFDLIQDDALRSQKEVLEDIRYALDNNQFVLHYQPKVNMRTGTVTGAEALIRWQHPKRGMLGPLEFLPVIEKSNMMVEVGEWVIKTSLRQISHWRAIGVDMPISVNIAALHLQKLNFTQRLTEFLAVHHDVEACYLELEILETSALEDMELATKTMNDCMALGVNFALDDFGTGYSSLTYFRRLPAAMIKIDQSFVRAMLEDDDDLAIVEGVITLAQSFNRNVIAEGVETIEQGAALLELGCDLAQGYGIARPMLACDIPAWINEWKPDARWQIKI
jgi:diguanylate cyclase (GGDEF)-like protein/PAS domain S-box-containing protein